ncbi:alpha/beta fold hydrolase [Jiulongibacter sp. NS-SX5]|uniref:alpha/beta fold hydrolase n=1 Tax=Jiulongibacter sp. NS-SX5 TaxID=3463854 RepID=UPI004058330A
MKSLIKTLLIPVLASTQLMFTSCESDLAPNEAETIYVSYDDAQMPVYLQGNREAKKVVVLIHGGPGGNGLEYSIGNYATDLEENLLMAYWDQRGQGMSQGKYGEEKITVGQMAEDLEAVVRTLKKHLGEDFEVYLLGHSWGGMLGTKYMVDPAKAALVNGWIEASGAHDIPFLNKSAVNLFKKVSTEQIAAENSIEEWQAIKDWVEGIDPNNITEEQGGEINQKGFEVESYLVDAGLIQSPSFAEGTFAKVVASPINWARSTVTGLYTSNVLTPEIESTSLSDQLYKIEKPCLFLYGKYDFVVPPDLGEDAFDKVSSNDKKLVIFENSGHSPMYNEEQKFVQEVLSFVGL